MSKKDRANTLQPTKKAKLQRTSALIKIPDTSGRFVLD